jgi:hypothetical protein
MFPIGEDYISCHKINGSENDFIKNLYEHGLPSLVSNYLSFKVI